MSHGVLEILKYFLLALIWLFFLYATRMVYVEVRRSREDKFLSDQGLAAGSSPGAAPPPSAPSERTVSLRLSVVAPEDRRGQIFDLDREVTLGRAAGCAVSLRDDTYASSVHARVFESKGDLWIEDLGSRNGTFLNDERLTAASRLRRGDKIQVGSTLLEVTR